MIVEGILVLDALSGVGRHADFLVYVRCEGGNGLSKVISDYNSRQRPEANAQFTLEGFGEHHLPKQVERR